MVKVDMVETASVVEEQAAALVVTVVTEAVMAVMEGRDMWVASNPGPKFRSQIQVPNPISKVQRKGNGTGADNIILQATITHP